MIASKPEKTFADYVGIALSPILIMIMIGSVMFFLLEVSYEGEYAGRLRWTIFWFVLASVLISRISIEQGSTHAGVYGAGLALATGMMISRFVNFAFGVWCFLGLIWWCASKLTWDCTLIDDDEDASGEGLLQVAQFDEHAASGMTETPVEKKSNVTRQFWKQLFRNRSEREGQPHAPGLWVVYFSLFALMIFGAGELFIPPADLARRNFGFALLWIYAAAALGLLLTTSFLGLRRYLRQRRLVMPHNIARSWIGQGAILAGGILLACLLIPRPEAEYSLTSLAGKIGSPTQAVSKNALLRDNAEELSQDSNAGGDKPGSVKDGDSPGQRTAKGQATGTKNKDAKTGKLGGAVSRTTPLGLSSGNALRWILYAVFALIAIYLLIRHGSKLLQGFRQIIRDLASFLMNLLGLRRQTPNSSGQANTTQGPRVEPRRFVSFANPFATGKASHMSMTELVCYTFEALQAWSRESGVERRPDQTPLEFARVLTSACPGIHPEAQLTIQQYVRIAYAGLVPPVDCSMLLERLWQRMNVERPAQSPSLGSR